MLFSKNKIRFTIYKKNRNAVSRVITPQGDTFTYNNKTYFLDKENYYMQRGIASFSYVENTALPIQLKDIVVKSKEQSYPLENIAYSSDKLHTFIKQKTASDILTSVKDNSAQNLALWLGFGVLALAIGGVYFALSGQINDILEVIRDLIQAINQGGGF